MTDLFFFGERQPSMQTSPSSIDKEIQELTSEVKKYQKRFDRLQEKFENMRNRDDYFQVTSDKILNKFDELNTLIMMYSVQLEMAYDKKKAQEAARAKNESKKKSASPTKKMSAASSSQKK